MNFLCLPSLNKRKNVAFPEVSCVSCNVSLSDGNEKPQ